MFFGTVLTDPTEQSLGQNTDNCRGNKKSLYVHVQEPDQATNTVFSVERGQDFMPCKGCLDVCLCREDITYFANDDNIWILPDYMP